MTRVSGGFTFAESPEVAAPDARIIWRAEIDPGTLPVRAAPATRDDPDGIDPRWIEPWLTIVDDPDGYQHAVLSDGRHHIRFDVEHGRLIAGRRVVLHYGLYGVDSAARRVLPLRGLLQLLRDRRFPVALFPVDHGNHRAIRQLRVRDALDDSASLRDIAAALFGEDQVAAEWRGRSDFLRSRVRRLTREATMLAKGGYRRLLSLPHRRRSLDGPDAARHAE